MKDHQIIPGKIYHPAQEGARPAMRRYVEEIIEPSERWRHCDPVVVYRQLRNNGQYVDTSKRCKLTEFKEWTRGTEGT